MNAPLHLRAPAAPARARRGASRAGETAARGFPGQRWLVPGLFVVLLAAVGEMGFTAFREVANVPIRHVSVNGDFRFIDRTRIEESMLPHLGTGYFMVDLAQIRITEGCREQRHPFVVFGLGKLALFDLRFIVFAHRGNPPV